MKKEVFLLLGSNLGNREEYLAMARYYIGAQVGEITDCSSIYETEPWGFESESLFLNQVIKMNSDYSSFEILDKIKAIESLIGRDNSDEEGYSSRTIDVDILLFGNEVINTPKLIIPHSKLNERLFALIPLVEILGEGTHPEIGKSFIVLLQECQDNMKVSIYNEKKT